MYVFFFSLFDCYLLFYSLSFEERSKALETITQTLQESMTFEDFCVQVCCPGQSLQGGSGSSASISGMYIPIDNK